MRPMALACLLAAVEFLVGEMLTKTSSGSSAICWRLLPRRWKMEPAADVSLSVLAVGEVDGAYLVQCCDRLSRVPVRPVVAV